MSFFANWSLQATLNTPKAALLGPTTKTDFTDCLVVNYDEFRTNYAYVSVEESRKECVAPA